jgi:hypothetical protein
MSPYVSEHIKGLKDLGALLRLRLNCVTYSHAVASTWSSLATKLCCEL